jgi:hypothetical protein
VGVSSLKIRSLRATPVNVSLARHHPTASDAVESTPLVRDSTEKSGLPNRVRQKRCSALSASLDNYTARLNSRWHIPYLAAGTMKDRYGFTRYR